MINFNVICAYYGYFNQYYWYFLHFFFTFFYQINNNNQWYKILIYKFKHLLYNICFRMDWKIWILGFILCFICSIWCMYCLITFKFNIHMQNRIEYFIINFIIMVHPRIACHFWTNYAFLLVRKWILRYKLYVLISIKNVNIALFDEKIHWNWIMICKIKFDI